MAKIVYNACYGGFSVSKAGLERYAELKGLKVWWVKIGYGMAACSLVPEEERRNDLWKTQTLSERDFDRADPVLVQVVEELRSDANGACANLRIAEVPSGGKYRIEEYDGFESVVTPEEEEWQIAP